MRGLFLIAASVAVLTGLAAASSPAFSQKRGTACDRAKSTAESMECINRQFQNAQSRLNESYKQYMDSHDPALRAAAEKAQHEWLSYRDAQCAWESAWADPPALARIYEVSCLSALTETRADILASIAAPAESGESPREFGARPRWMNVLAHDSPDIFWRYGSWLRTDLDCDGREEEIMAGLSVAPEKETDGNSGISFSGAIVVAAVENPATGKPKAQTFEFPVMRESAAPHACDADVRLTPVNRPGLADDKTACLAALRIDTRGCAPIMLYRKDKGYELVQYVEEPLTAQ